jgi:hypothetical protein
MTQRHGYPVDTTSGTYLIFGLTIVVRQTLSGKWRNNGGVEDKVRGSACTRICDLTNPHPDVVKHLSNEFWSRHFEL